MTLPGQQATSREFQRTRLYLTVAWVFSAIGLGYWLSLSVLVLAIPDQVSAAPVFGYLVNVLGTLILIPTLVSLVVLNRMMKMRSALKGGEITSLKELNSTAWGVLALILANPVTGAFMLLMKTPMNKILVPDVLDSNEVLAIKHLTKLYPVKRSLAQVFRGARDLKVHAVDDVSFSVGRGQIYGLAGESGSGKTTVLRCSLMLTRPTSGSIFFMGKDIAKLTGKEMKRVRTKLQVVFQDPYESVNPRMTIFEIVAEGLFVNKMVSSKEEARERATKALRDVQLIPAEEFLDRYPHELSGGQRQRVAVARALVLEPELILADEPVSMLDVSVRAEVINVLLAIRQKRGISVVMVTHDLALSKDVVDQLAIMYLGEVVETGSAQEVVSSPYHPYTQALVAAVPVPDPQAPKIRVLAKGEIPTNISPPSGCRFHPRCAFAKEICSTTSPKLVEATSGRQVACHFWKEAFEAFSKGTIKQQAAGLEVK